MKIIDLRGHLVGKFENTFGHGLNIMRFWITATRYNRRYFLEIIVKKSAKKVNCLIGNFVIYETEDRFKNYFCQ